MNLQQDLHAAKRPDASVPTHLNNRFLLAYKKKRGAVPWNPNDETGDSFPGAVYIARMLEQVDALIGPRELTFLLTSDIRSIPISGPGVIVVLREDEWCRLPPYATKVEAVFKAHGDTLAWDRNPLKQFSYDALLCAIQDTRTEIVRVPTRIRHLTDFFRRTILRAPAGYHVFDYPLGFFRQLDLPIVPIADRRYDVYFAGSIIGQRAAKHPWLARFETPKVRSRRKMVEELQAVKSRRPDMHIAIELTKSFWQTGRSEAEAYSQTMMDSRVCIVPRGTHLETFRYFEAMRAGCAVICESLPHRRYYDGAPHIMLDKWSDLESALDALLKDPVELQRRQEASLAWWRDKCSETAVAQFFAESILELEQDRRAD